MIFKQVREIITGKKTQTRRVVKEGERVNCNADGSTITQVNTPSGRKKWAVGQKYAVVPKRAPQQVYYRHVWDELQLAHTQHVAFSDSLTALDHAKSKAEDWKGVLYNLGYRPLYIQFVDIRQERLHDLTEEDAIAEGIRSINPDPKEYKKSHLYPWTGLAYYDYMSKNWHKNNADGVCSCYTWGKHNDSSAVHSYRTLWDSINAVSTKGNYHPKATYGWNANPLVWVLEFQVVT